MHSDDDDLRRAIEEAPERLDLRVRAWESLGVSQTNRDLEDLLRAPALASHEGMKAFAIAASEFFDDTDSFPEDVAKNEAFFEALSHATDAEPHHEALSWLRELLEEFRAGLISF